MERRLIIMQGWIEIILRTIGMLILLFTVAKISGKKQVAQLSYFDYISRITLGGIAAMSVLDLDINFLYGVLATFIWTITTYSLDLLALKSKTIRDFIDGKGTIVIKDGKILEDNLNKEQYTSDMLLKQLRSKSAFNIADVEFAVIEPTGELNVLLKRDRLPVTLKDLGIHIPNEKEPQTIIMDGKPLHEPLESLGLNINWLKKELEKLGVAIHDIYLCQIDSKGHLIVDLLDRKTTSLKNNKSGILKKQKNE